jgi:hypothetical protein
VTATLSVYRDPAEVEMLRAENDRLRAEVSRLRGTVLLPFSGIDPPCVKCKQPYKYMRGPNRYVTLRYQKARPWLGRPERFKRHCYACGATWYESTADVPSEVAR